ncbi:MAG: glycosyltransferase WbuB [Candidatus Electrothrix sp. AU1_5]|nr:glycosyltransferase WbuB [Candidatus Electrothrix gigas]
MNILILTFYYPPDLSAGSFRVDALVKQLSTKISPEDTVSIITTMPNRYHSYQTDQVQEVEQCGNIHIHRIRIPQHKSGFRDQVRSFTVFFYNALKIARKEQYDAVFATSSRLFTAFLGMLIARWKKIPLYLDIRDIFTETIESVSQGRMNRLSLLFIYGIESLTVNYAKKINLVSEGFAPYFRTRYPYMPISFFPNGIDAEFADYNFTATQKKEKITVVYAGNIGKSQGLENILPPLAEKYPAVHFIIIGDGSAKVQLIHHLKGARNVILMDPMPRTELLTMYRESDYLFLHLNDYAAFKRVLPSKIFEYGATGKPVLAGVSGYAKEFIEKNLPDSIVFAPNDPDDFSKKFNPQKIPDHISREEFLSAYSRSSIMDTLTQDVLETLA